MLKNEPDTNTQPTTNAADPVDSPPPARRRRAAVRAAGPPGGTEGAPVIETVSSTPEHTTDEPTGPGLAGEGAPAQPPDLSTASEPPAPRTAAKRTRTTSPAKKAAAKKTATKVAESADSSGDSTAPPPRKRSSKKAAATAADGTPPAVAGPADTPQTDQRVDVPPHTAVSSMDEPATVDVQASPAAELKPSDESIGVVDAEQEQPPTDQEVVPPGDELEQIADGLTEAAAVPVADEIAAGEDASERDGQRRRRRRRRRRGEDAGASPDDPSDVVVRVRESRRERSSQAVTGIEGSTRMEAKRQRRREGREAGRRRVPILSEAEFLARRESVTRNMIIRQREDLAQIAVLEDDILVEHYVDRDSAMSLIGNVYLGRVQNVLPSMEAAFIDIGRGRNAVLYAGEVDWDAFGAEGQNRKVEKVLKSGQTVLVQVSKDPVGTKGARLTNHVSIPGRYLVYAPSGHLSGISRKLPDNERKRLRDILADLVGEASVIVRTAAEGASEEELVRDVNRLQAQWQDIEKKVASGNAPQLLYGEPDLTVRIVRDLFTEDFSELIIQGNGSMNDAYDSVEAYVTHVAPHLKDRLRRWESDADLFAEYRLDEQIAKGLERKVFLPSGGSLIIERTEAMTVIDVNTGKFTGAGGNLEATVTSNNLEAAEEIVRQLRLRDIGGIIVIDFIDMVLPANRELLLRRLVECLGRDRTRHQVAEVTSLGLVQMTRKRIGTGLLEAFSTECPVC